MDTPICFQAFCTDLNEINIPKRFTYPFNYTPHPLAIIACKELQNKIEKDIIPYKDFGLENSSGWGKMFGVLVVQNTTNQIGYLAAFSGKLGDSNHWKGFVPPVFDILEKDGFFKKGEAEIFEINKKIESLASDPLLTELKKQLSTLEESYNIQLLTMREAIKEAKKKRTILRSAYPPLSPSEILKLDKESADEHYTLKRYKTSTLDQIKDLKNQIEIQLSEINRLKKNRKTKSAQLQDKLFQSYTFLNAIGESKSLLDIFVQNNDTIVPPSGSGECCAPKLLQYAFSQGMKPIAMAEFWYGKSPSSEIRHHLQYYPACRSKCLPILTHMLKGLSLEENPMHIRLAKEKKIAILYEDAHILVINKPHDFLSVPGGEIKDSIYMRIKALYPLASGPLIVHRLDMSTSGIMLVALSKKAHYHLQRQFELKTIRKKYYAILSGELLLSRGEISLPLRVDLDDRPRQLVDFIYGKPSHTRWERVSTAEGETKVYFYPTTGRTHQLRVHASHDLGLGMPIKGDDLYGTRSDRLYLQAISIEFIHPISGKRLEFHTEPEF